MRRRGRQQTFLVDGGKGRDLRLFLLGALLGAGLVALVVFLAAGAKEKALVEQHVGAVATLEKKLTACERDRKSLMEMRDEATRKLGQCLAEVKGGAVAPSTLEETILTPPQAEIAPQGVPPAITEVPVPAGVKVPFPRRKPTPPVASSSLVVPLADPGAPRLLRQSGGVLKVGEQREISAGFAVRLVAISKRSSGRFCVVAGDPLGKAGLRVPHGGSKTFTWSGQKLEMLASVKDRDSCSLTVRPIS